MRAGVPSFRAFSDSFSEGFKVLYRVFYLVQDMVALSNLTTDNYRARDYLYGPGEWLSAYYDKQS